MICVLGKGSIMNVLMGQLLPTLAAHDEKFNAQFQSKSMNECSNRMYSALARLAKDERDGQSSVMADFGVDDLMPIAISFYENDTTEDEMIKMFKDRVEEKKKVATKADEKPKSKAKGKKEEKPAAPVAPAGGVPSSPKRKSTMSVVKTEPEPVKEEDDDFSLFD